MQTLVRMACTGSCQVRPALTSPQDRCRLSLHSPLPLLLQACLRPCLRQDGSGNRQQGGTMRSRTSSSGTALRSPAGRRNPPWCTCPLCAPSTQALGSACTQRWCLLLAFSTEACRPAVPASGERHCQCHWLSQFHELFWLACHVVQACLQQPQASTPKLE